MKPFLKYTGAKYSELNKFQKHIPDNINNFYEPFVGGGSVYLNTIAKNYFINDKDKKIYNFWKDISHDNIMGIEYLYHNNISKRKSLENEQELKLFFWNNKDCKYLKKVYKFLEKENISCPTERLSFYKKVIMEQFYYNQRSLFNMLHDPISTYFVKEYAYSSMCRYNKKGEFNIPYGGISYNEKKLSENILNMKKYVSSKMKENTQVYNEDFEVFLSNKKFQENDFIFLDPPYTTSFSSYGGNSFTKKDHERLKKVLTNVFCKFMMVINEDDFIKDLYKDFYVLDTYHKKYKVNIKNRVSSETNHLVITNYRKH